jgi:hypothetical protein
MSGARPPSDSRRNHLMCLVDGGLAAGELDRLEIVGRVHNLVDQYEFSGSRSLAQARACRWASAIESRAIASAIVFLVVKAGGAMGRQAYYTKRNVHFEWPNRRQQHQRTQRQFRPEPETDCRHRDRVDRPSRSGRLAVLLAPASLDWCDTGRRSRPKFNNRGGRE